MRTYAKIPSSEAKPTPAAQEAALLIPDSRNSFEDAPLSTPASSSSPAATSSISRLATSTPSATTDPEPATSTSAASNTTPATGPSASSSQTPRRQPLRAPGDGVFANLSAKPEVSAQPIGKTYEEIEPPSYADVVHHEAIPSYYETTVIASGFSEDGEVLINGLPVGDLFTLLVNMLVSMSFDLIGYLLTALLATSHAAKCGSRYGLGVTLIRYGLYIETRTAEEETDFELTGETLPSEEEEGQIVQNHWVSYLLIFVGLMIMIRANADFINAKRMRAVILASADAAPSTQYL